MGQALKEGRESVPNKGRARAKALTWVCTWPFMGGARRPFGWGGESI